MKHSFIDKYAALKSPIHALDPRIKSLIFFSCVVFIVLTPIYDTIKFALYLILILVLGAFSRVPLIHIVKKINHVLPFVFLIVMFVPFVKKGEVAGSLSLGPFKASVSYAGLWIMLNVIVKAFLSVAALSLLISTTRFSDLLKGFEKMYVPQTISSILAFMYRFIFILTDDTHRLLRAYGLRNFGGFSLRKIRTMGNMIGILFISTYERGERVYSAMGLRGYDGKIRTMSELRLRPGEIVLLAVFLCCLAAIRIGRF